MAAKASRNLTADFVMGEFDGASSRRRRWAFELVVDEDISRVHRFGPAVERPEEAAVGPRRVQRRVREHRRQNGAHCDQDALHRGADEYADVGIADDGP